MALRESASQYSSPKVFHSLFQLANTLVPFAALWWLMAKTTHVSWLLTWLLAVPAAGLMMRIFILQHDCGHGSFFRSRRLNDALGLLLGVLTVTPYFYWRRTHALHHKHFGKLEHRRELGYFVTLTVAEYEALPEKKRFLYRLYRHPLVFCGLGGAYQFLFKHRYPFDAPKSWRPEWMSVHFTNAGLLVGGFALCELFGWQTVLRVHLPILLLTGWIGVWLFYIQHVFPDGYFEHEAGWNLEKAALEGSSYYRLPRVLRWFSGDIGLHHVHHYSQLIPNYRLQEAHEGIAELSAVKPLMLKDSLSCWNLKLWDEEQRRLVRLPPAEAEERSEAANPEPAPSSAVSG